MDEAFLRFDTIHTTASAGTAMVFDGTRAAPGTLTGAALRERMAVVSDHMQAFRLVPIPDPDRPGRHVWLDAGPPDVTQHVHETDLGGHAGPREIAAAASRLNARPLPRTRPLWEMHVLTGLANGRVGVLFRFHHSLADGAAYYTLQNAVFPTDEPPPPAPPVSPRPPSLGAGEPDEVLDAPATRFNQPLCGLRDFAFDHVATERLLALKDAADVSFVSTFIAVTTGALRAWLDERGELPDQPLVAEIPTSDRRAGATPAVGNSLGAMSMRIPTDEPDPRRRVGAVHEGLQAAKTRIRYVATDRPRHRSRVNLSITSLPGIPLAWAGAPLDMGYPIALVASSGLVVACATRGPTAGLGIHVDREQGEGGWSLMAALLGSLAELEAAFGLSR